MLTLILKPLVTDGEHQGIHEKVCGHICRTGQDSVSKTHPTISRQHPLNHVWFSMQSQILWQPTNYSPQFFIFGFTFLRLFWNTFDLALIVHLNVICSD